MKTVKKGTEIKRVNDKMASKLVKKGWKYCPKEEYKAQFKDEPKEKEEEEKE